ncbi:Zinc finger protein 26, partial [Stegodyphus mimosarum]
MKHARTDHRTDLSMWCKLCGKCFSNAGVLVSHIKERACIKEEMIYKCGVKDCVFETISGQTFVHHLRHCHKGSPFIFCVHCQKIFTLPHCLILHMQDDCPFKDRNRRNPGSTTPVEADSTTKISAPSPPQKPVYTPPVVNTAARPSTPATISTPRASVPIAVRPIVPATTHGRGSILSSRGRARGRGRGRGRGRPPSESSESEEDPDDPSWRPDETLGSATLRRSGRWAKKVNDVINVEPSLSGKPIPTPKKTLSLADLNVKKMLNCPCCDFMAAFQSVLEDHYIANHKVANKNACLVCHLKFESTKLFLEHFEDHIKGKLTNVMSSVVESTADTAAAKHSPAPPSSANDPPVVITEENSLDATTSSDLQKGENRSKPSNSDENVDVVVKNISEVNIVDPTTDKSENVKIPYQAAIHDKSSKDSKFKKFAELKSPKDLVAMRSEEKLKHFFKCVLYHCSFTTDDRIQYLEHLNANHKGKRMHCAYCLSEFFCGKSLTEHMLVEHAKRQYQCSNCFYRAFSKIHVQIHIKNYHAKDTGTEVYTCKIVDLPSDLKPSENNELSNTTWPFICAIGDCRFQTFDPKEFKNHNDVAHRTVSVFFCHYCHVDFISLKRLMNHYRLHGINTFQCSYCIHGSETKDEIMLHLSNAHADQPLMAYMRGSEEEASSEAMKIPVSVGPERNQALEKPAKAVSDNSQEECAESQADSSVPMEIGVSKEETQQSFESELYVNVGGMLYPKELENIFSELYCGVPCCEDKVENILTYIGHLRNIHAATNFPCPHCPEIVETWNSFKNHLQCHGPNLYACGFTGCSFYHSDKQQVEVHLTNHLGADVQVVVIRESSENAGKVSSILSLPRECPFKIGNIHFECLFCRYKSSNRKVMKNHMYREMEYSRFSCSVCNKNCVSRREVKDHFISVHPKVNVECTTNKNFEIENCVKSFLGPKISYPDVKTNESCAVCNKKFQSLTQWQLHLYYCLRKQYRSYDCGYCQDSFFSLKALKYHIDEHHSPNPLLFCKVSSSKIDENVGKLLQQHRLKYLKQILQNNNINWEQGQEDSSLTKFYVCSICSFEATHRFVVLNHVQSVHKDVSVDIKKILRKETEDEASKVICDDNSNDSIKMVSEAKNKGAKAKRYRCGFCVKKFISLQEFEDHMERTHPVIEEADYFYYYSPDTTIKFSPDDKDIYECAYCKSSKENLFALQKHAELMHSEMQFKVKGYFTQNRERSAIMACAHCYLRLESRGDLKRHMMSCHPSLPQKYIGDFQGVAAKRSLDMGDLPNKKVKFEGTVYVCSHCGAAFSSQEQIITHSKQTHSRLDEKYTCGESGIAKFYKCEFCQFTGEKCHLENHLKNKHKTRVLCFYCNKRFEFATKLKEHHDVFHKNLPVKYCQETVGFDAGKSENKVSVSSNNLSSAASPAEVKCSEPSIPESGFSNYGKKPEPVDLSALSVLMDKGDQCTRLPLDQFTELFNIFPK